MTTKASENTGRVNPKKFSLWLLLLGILMLFSGLTSAYIVRKGDGNWFDFEIPSYISVFNNYCFVELCNYDMGISSC